MFIKYIVEHNEDDDDDDGLFKELTSCHISSFIYHLHLDFKSAIWWSLLQSALSDLSPSQEAITLFCKLIQQQIFSSIFLICVLKV